MDPQKLQDMMVSYVLESRTLSIPATYDLMGQAVIPREEVELSMFKKYMLHALGVSTNAIYWPVALICCNLLCGRKKTTVTNYHRSEFIKYHLPTKSKLYCKRNYSSTSDSMMTRCFSFVYCCCCCTMCFLLVLLLFLLLLFLLLLQGDVAAWYCSIDFRVSS